MIFTARMGITRHLTKYNNKMKTIEDLKIMEIYNPKGGRLTLYEGSESDTMAQQKAQREAKRLLDR